MANNHKKRWSESLILKTTMRYHFTPVRWPSSKSLQTVNAGEGVEKRECPCTVGGNVNWYNLYGRRYGDSLKKTRNKPPYDPATPLLHIYPEETRVEKYTCIPLFIAALFTIARTWKQPRCPSTDEWIKKLWYIYTMEYYSAIKRSQFLWGGWT